MRFEDGISINDIINHSPNEHYEYKGFCHIFKIEPDTGIKVGDYAIVHARDALKIVKIVQVHDTP